MAFCHLNNIWAAVSHPQTAIPREERLRLSIKTAASIACLGLVVAEATPLMVGLAVVAATDPSFEALRMMDQDGAAWLAAHRPAPSPSLNPEQG